MLSWRSSLPFRPCLSSSLVRLAILSSLAWVAACNGDRTRGPSGYEGTYAIRTHTRNDTSCDGAGDAVTDGPAYFQLKADSILGKSILGWHDCTGPGACDDAISLTGSFVSIDGQWRMRSSSASGDTSCTLGLTDGTVAHTDTGVHIEIRQYSGTITVPTAADCQPDLAETHMSELSCDGIEVIDGDTI